MKKDSLFCSKKNPYGFMLALFLGVLLAVGGSVLATSVGTNVAVTGNITVSSSSASSSVTYALGVGTSTPSVIFSVGGAGGTSTGHGYFTGGLGVGAITTTAGRIVANTDLGVATTTPAQALSVVGNVYLTSGLGIGIATTSAGTLELAGNALFGDAAGDRVMLNAASLILNNAGTTTIASSNANAWSYATSSANIPLLKLDTSNTRIGISTTTPGATLGVAGDGYFTGGFGIGIATTSAGTLELAGNALFGDAAGDRVMLNAASLILNNAGTTTIASSNANAWSYATSSANIPLLKLDTSNTRIGISTTTPGATLAVEGDGTAIVMGNATSTVKIHSTGSVKGGCIELESAAGDGSVFRLYATTSAVAVFESGSCR